MLIQQADNMRTHVQYMFTDVRVTNTDETIIMFLVSKCLGHLYTRTTCLQWPQFVGPLSGLYTQASLCVLYVCCTKCIPPFSHTVPTQPLNFIGAALNSTTIRLQWDPPTTPNGIIEQYIVETTDGGGTMTNDTVSAPQTSTDFTGLSPNTTYTITVRARNGAETSSPSPSITITTSG